MQTATQKTPAQLATIPQTPFGQHMQPLPLDQGTTLSGNSITQSGMRVPNEMSYMPPQTSCQPIEPQLQVRHSTTTDITTPSTSSATQVDRLHLAPQLLPMHMLGQTAEVTIPSVEATFPQASSVLPDRPPPLESSPMTSILQQAPGSLPAAGTHPPPRSTTTLPHQQDSLTSSPSFATPLLKPGMKDAMREGSEFATIQSLCKEPVVQKEPVLQKEPVVQEEPVIQQQFPPSTTPPTTSLLSQHVTQHPPSQPTHVRHQSPGETTRTESVRVVLPGNHRASSAAGTNSSQVNSQRPPSASRATTPKALKHGLAKPTLTRPNRDGGGKAENENWVRHRTARPQGPPPTPKRSDRLAQKAAASAQTLLLLGQSQGAQPTMSSSGPSHHQIDEVSIDLLQACSWILGWFFCFAGLDFG